MKDKKSLRKHAKETRKNLDINKISSLIISNIRQLKEYKTAKKIMIFYPLENEVNLLELLKDDKDFYLPRMSGETLECCPYTYESCLNTADFGVKEPLTASINKNIMDIIFVPALCVDKDCMRLGYGKGFYDRFLADYRGVTIIPIPEELIVPSVCPDFNDIACKKVVTQKRVFCSC